jgi:RIO kinase 1
VTQLPDNPGAEDLGGGFLAEAVGLRRSQGRDHLNQLDVFFDKRLITEVLGIIKTGKEASAYCCRAGSDLGGGLVCAKVYRARQYRFKNDAIYQEERTRGMRGQARRALAKKTEFGRKVQTGSWVNHEFETLEILYEAGADVPRPFRVEADALLMEYIGVEEEPAPQLNTVRLGRPEAEKLLPRILDNVETMLACNRVHGDLSPHNILYWEGHPTLIDFPQAVDPRFNSSAELLLKRDIDNVCRYFVSCGAEANSAAIAADLWRRYRYAQL